MHLCINEPHVRYYLKDFNFIENLFDLELLMGKSRRLRKRGRSTFLILNKQAIKKPLDISSGFRWSQILSNPKYE